MAVANRNTSSVKYQAVKVVEWMFMVMKDPSYTISLSYLLILMEIVMNILVIQYVKYTEIDWTAYMQEVEGFINGTRDYTQLKGDTGPLVYPAGFVYIFSIMYHVTESGKNVRLAQYIFLALYIINLILVVRIYDKSRRCPPYLLFIMCLTSYRIHSIFVLRLFNDGVAMLIFYAACNCFMSHKWTLGCIFYSFALSVKMNIILFAPALLVLLLIENGIFKTIINLLLCLIIQIVLAIPFLRDNPLGYLSCSFNFGRQFFYKWTVNWRLIPEELFLDKRFQIFLLLCHVTLLLAFIIHKWTNGFRNLFSIINPMKNWSSTRASISPHDIAYSLFVCNFIGMCFSRSLHYQFYVWYYHSLPLLLCCIRIPSSLGFAIMAMIELCWNTYPSTVYSSFRLHVLHGIILLGLWFWPIDRKTGILTLERNGKEKVK